jgi:ribosomal protein L20
MPAACCCCVRRILAMAKGFRGKSKNCFRNAKPQVEEALEHQVPRSVWLRAALDSFR